MRVWLASEHGTTPVPPPTKPSSVPIGVIMVSPNRCNHIYKPPQGFEGPFQTCKAGIQLGTAGGPHPPPPPVLLIALKTVHVQFVQPYVAC